MTAYTKSAVIKHCKWNIFVNIKAKTEHKITIAKLFSGNLSKLHFTYIFPSLKYGLEGPKQNNRIWSKVENVKRRVGEIMNIITFFSFWKNTLRTSCFLSFQSGKVSYFSPKKSAYYFIPATPSALPGRSFWIHWRD